MDIDLGQRSAFKVKYDGAVYTLREPTVKETLSLSESTESDKTFVLKFLVSLGLPEDVANALEISKVQILMEALVGSITEKK